MAFSQEIYARALGLLRDASLEKKRIFRESTKVLYEKNPDLLQIDQKLRALNLKTVSAVFSGESVKDIQNQIKDLSAQKEEILKTAGAENYTPLCPVCGDEFFIGGKYCECVKAAATEIALKELYKTVGAQNYDFDNFDISYYPENCRGGMQKLLNFCREYAQNFTAGSQNLLFMGKTGLGKTHISVAIAKEIIKKGYSVKYYSAQNLFSVCEKEHFSYNGQTPLSDEMLTCDLLIIDDLGAEFITNFSKSALYNIVNTRYNYGLPTLISTNFDVDKIEEKYEERISSRFMGNYTAKLFKGNDIRQLRN
ncbi:MAG: ATP-binding protein [Oscillospiraceae bacterium]|nr:ATP-binding protein [Candidatus Equicaccousia limihippi]